MVLGAIQSRFGKVHDLVEREQGVICVLLLD
jgi:hypothetical protein